MHLVHVLEASLLARGKNTITAGMCQLFPEKSMAGTRACVGYHLANRLMYGILGRLILGWSIQAPGPVDIHPDTYNTCPSSLVVEPKEFL